MNEPSSSARPLSGLTLGISISESEDLWRHGFTPADVNLVTVDLCRRLIALGAGVNLGHQWRPGGVMEAVTQMAGTYQESLSEPILHSFLAWPDRAGLSSLDQSRLTRILTIHEGLPVYTDQGVESRPKALTEMRQLSAARCHGSIVLSGRLRASSLMNSENFVPGLVEETALMLTGPTPKPVYLSRMMGGVATMLVDTIENSRPPGHFDPFLSPRLRGYLDRIASVGVERLAAMCGLTLRQLRELFGAQNLDTIVRLTSLGMRHPVPRPR